MFVEKFTGPGSTPARRKFWEQCAAIVSAARKLEGRNVSVNEFQGKGTIINVDRKIGTPSPSGCSCNCLPCVGSISGPSLVSFTWETDWAGFGCTDISGSVTNKALDQSDCPYIDGDGYFTSCWFCNPNLACQVQFGQYVDYPTNSMYVELLLTYYCADGICPGAPEGWYLSVFVTDNFCAAGCINMEDCANTCVYLGNANTFDSDLPFSINMEIEGFGVLGTVTGTFKPDCEFSPAP